MQASQEAHAPRATRAGHLRNVAIIAHVDHGKTTLVDQLLKQSGNFRVGELEKLEGGQHGLIMDSNPLERERGITILSKNCAVNYTDPDGAEFRINIIDTPGHADFGGEVERVLRMADGCLLVVDAFEGPMPQTRFVLAKALEAGLRPALVVNKCDRPDADPDRVVTEVFDLLVELGADDHTLDFPVVYTSAKGGWALNEADGPVTDHPGTDMRPVFELIVNYVPAPKVEVGPELRMLITTLDYSDYVGRIGIGRVFGGAVTRGQRVVLLKHQPDGTIKRTNAKIGKLLAFEGLGRREAERVEAGDLAAVTGVEGIDIGDTVADPAVETPLPPVTVDEPTISMIFRINDSPFAGQDGEFVTSRQLGERLKRELQHNVALRVEPGLTTDEFFVSGRGVLHLGILLETMRREGYELSIGKPVVIQREINGVMCEPVERLVIDCPNEHVGSVMQLVGERKGDLLKMEARSETLSHLVFDITSRALIGLRGRIMTSTQGEGLMHHTFDRFEPVSGEPPSRQNGVMIATEAGPVTAYAVEGLHDRGVLFVKPGDQVYAGQVVGEHNKANDIPVNITRLKALTNIRSANKEATVTLKTPRSMSLEQSIEYIEDDELIELTPKVVRLRKRLLDEGARRRHERKGKG
ncbi:MAG: translational GTPase TypA [Phycisphaerales bacterium]|nr:translational GTPase TypA [Phycisphaerales bacterium]